ncbi:Phenylacetaldehyde reductase (2-phenylethanol synthase) [Durusdinium trenchii]|uniref:Phenylacetaldehyde reductase (2-phenylethanol synthase) n=1 Tax=Durusdinium trenchii TaxID=1381693 RepID=A0ABP0HKC2_9DINO
MAKWAPPVLARPWVHIRNATDVHHQPSWLSQSHLQFTEKLFSKGIKTHQILVAQTLHKMTGTVPQVAFVGRSNVGKSTLLNMILHGRPAPVSPFLSESKKLRNPKAAPVSNNPGRTRHLFRFELGAALELVDLPGYGFAKTSKEVRESWRELVDNYLSNADHLERVISLVDARVGVKSSDEQLWDLLLERERQIMVVLTKADQCTPDMLNRTMAHVVSFLETMPSSYVWPYVHAVSGLEGHGVDFLRASVSLLTLDPLSGRRHGGIRLFGQKSREFFAPSAVVGAGGFIASHIATRNASDGHHLVKLLLERGHVVRGTLRDAKDPRKTEHLMALPGASERLSLFSASLLEPNAFDEAVQGCRGVFHTASPLVPGKGVEDPETLVLRPAIEGTLNVLRSCQKAGTVKTVVLTSSMSAVAPVPEPPLKSEEHWSDPEEQKARGSFYGASKTLAERAAFDFVAKEMPSVRLATICPTMVLGPMLQPEVNMTMGAFRGWLKNGVPGHPKCQNDSMSFVDVRDCAAQHVAAMEMEDKAGRFMSLDCSIHWNDLAVLMKSLYPSMPAAEPVEGELRPVTRFDRARQDSLGVPVRPVPEILKEPSRASNESNDVTLSNPPVVAKFTTEALTGELLPLLEKAQGLLGATIGPDFRAPQARIVVLSSTAHLGATKELMEGDLMAPERYTQWGAYCQSKLANVLFAKESGDSARQAGLKITAVSCHPGAVDTDLARWTISPEGDPGKATQMRKEAPWADVLATFLTRTVQLGANTQVYLAAGGDGGYGSSGGQYFDNMAPGLLNPVANDEQLAQERSGPSAGIGRYPHLVIVRERERMKERKKERVSWNQPCHTRSLLTLAFGPGDVVRFSLQHGCLLLGWPLSDKREKEMILPTIYLPPPPAVITLPEWDP